ncbi:hypothetical protein FLJC2902T_04280 [Flavobacterium limnosediminis JC2902]|uniref:Uncharacterized protein n=1 Tax=Flavobacterium limnosediminis JC2902 TaxID=1341181 RepID=V6STH7_9FLAO|nr:hypothetical protein FLJC2902T_04280 [Flavobacterium limnosediminis JC2902]
MGAITLKNALSGIVNSDKNICRFLYKYKKYYIDLTVFI